MEAYGRAWRERDADAAVGLFTEDAEYRFSPFREPVVGSRAIHVYWEDVTSAQEELDVRMGTPFVTGDIVAAEWWATMVEDGEETTIRAACSSALPRMAAARPSASTGSRGPAAATRTPAGASSHVATGHVPVPGTWTCPARTPCGHRSEPGAGSRALRSHFVPKDMTRGQTPGPGT